MDMKNYDGQQCAVTITLLTDTDYEIDVEVTVVWEDGQEQWAILECPYEPGQQIYGMIAERINMDIPHPREIQWE